MPYMSIVQLFESQNFQEAASYVIYHISMPYMSIGPFPADSLLLPRSQTQIRYAALFYLHPHSDHYRMSRVNDSIY